MRSGAWRAAHAQLVLCGFAIPCHAQLAHRRLTLHLHACPPHPTPPTPPLTTTPPHPSPPPPRLPTTTATTPPATPPSVDPMPLRPCRPLGPGPVRGLGRLAASAAPTCKTLWPSGSWGRRGAAVRSRCFPTGAPRRGAGLLLHHAAVLVAAVQGPDAQQARCLGRPIQAWTLLRRQGRRCHDFLPSHQASKGCPQFCLPYDYGRCRASSPASTRWLSLSTGFSTGTQMHARRGCRLLALLRRRWQASAPLLPHSAPSTAAADVHVRHRLAPDAGRPRCSPDPCRPGAAGASPCSVTPRT